MRPELVAEAADPALDLVLAESGRGFCPEPAALEERIRRHRLERAGPTGAVQTFSVRSPKSAGGSARGSGR